MNVNLLGLQIHSSMCFTEKVQFSGKAGFLRYCNCNCNSYTSQQTETQVKADFYSRSGVFLSSFRVELNSEIDVP